MTVICKIVITPVTYKVLRSYDSLALNNWNVVHCTFSVDPEKMLYLKFGSLSWSTLCEVQRACSYWSAVLLRRLWHIGIISKRITSCIYVRYNLTMNRSLLCGVDYWSRKYDPTYRCKMIKYTIACKNSCNFLNP